MEFDISIVDTTFMKAGEFIAWLRDSIVGFAPEYGVFVKLGFALLAGWAINKYIRKDGMEFMLEVVLVYMILLLV